MPALTAKMHKRVRSSGDTIISVREISGYFWGAVTDTAWRVLWDSQMSLPPADVERYDHLKTIASDMMKAGRELTDSHKLMHIEARFFCGDKEDSLEKFEELGSSSLSQRPEYMDLGVRMYATAGRLDQAFCFT